MRIRHQHCCIAYVLVLGALGLVSLLLHLHGQFVAAQPAFLAVDIEPWQQRLEYALHMQGLAGLSDGLQMLGQTAAHCLLVCSRLCHSLDVVVALYWHAMIAHVAEQEQEKA